MRGERILITGGAGFIGSRLGRALAARGAEVLAFDNLHPQVHGHAPSREIGVPLVVADIRDRSALEGAVRQSRPTIVVHLAAETGTGQSADEPARYTEVNVVGTATLIEVLRQAAAPPKRLVLASTRAIYGEGAYADPSGQLRIPPPRRSSDMAAGRFGLFDERGAEMRPLPTPESVPVAPASVYGSSKLMQEYLLQQACGPWSNAILRLQNVFGPGQSLRNPYTGVLSIFCQQALEGRQLEIYEDGEIGRDFVYVDDVVDAFVRACGSADAAGRIINVGTGQVTGIGQAASRILALLGIPADRMRVSGAFRPGDVRHAVADIGLARSLLGWSPAVPFEQGVANLVAWAKAGGTNGAPHAAA